MHNMDFVQEFTSLAQKCSSLELLEENRCCIRPSSEKSNSSDRPSSSIFCASDCHATATEEENDVAEANTAPPQRTLAFDKNPKKKKGISTPEKQANDRVNSRLAGLSEILLYCIVCDQMLDLHNNTALKRSRCLVP
jgi:hypothetical protein